MQFHEYIFKTLRLALYVVVLGVLVGVGFVMYLWWWIVPELPATENLKEVQLQVPLRVYTSDGLAIAEFAEQRRIPLEREQIPRRMTEALLAIEDARFYDHPGVDWKGLLRAAVHLLRTGEIRQGGSTITMQLARNFFLTPERKFKRKFKEILLALRIETELTKDEILTLYLNKVFFGHRAYGIGAAAQVYYGREIQDLTLAEYAMLAGLPRAPSSHNPLVNPERALIRRNYILKRMLELGKIQQAEYQEAVAQPITARQHRFEVEAEAPYVAEMVRGYMVERFGREAAYTGGYQVITTVNSRLQAASQYALRKALLEYDQRHGYRGPVDHIALPDAWQQLKLATLTETLDTLLEDYSILGGGLVPAIILEVEDKLARAYSPQAGLLEIKWEGLAWARPYINDRRVGAAPKKAADVVKPGDVVYVIGMKQEDGEADSEQEKKPLTQADVGQVVETEAKTEAESPPPQMRWWLSQEPKVEGALVALNPETGSIMALSGGFDFNRNKYNRVTQAERQPGSNFKPFIYSAALEHGFTPASIINDAPVVYYTATQVWRPDNYSGRFYGPTRLRKALTLSRNLVSIRLMDSVGVNNTLDYVTRFGFAREKLPNNLTLALGTPSLTPLEVVSGFAVFANGGYRVEPYFIERMEDVNGKVLYQARPRRVCRACNLPLSIPLKSEENKPEGDAREDGEARKVKLTASSRPRDDSAYEQYAPRVITPQNAWIMTSILQDVITSGTARRALVLNRSDLAGKTGTTNEQRDAWFSGFNPDIVATAWVGFDQPRSLGSRETGSRAALPMWIEFMREALKDRPERSLPAPPGLVQARIDPVSGLLAHSGDTNAIFETFRSGHAPTRYAAQDASLSQLEDATAGNANGSEAVGSIREQLF